jgi:hypothetical protein
LGVAAGPNDHAGPLAAAQPVVTNINTAAAARRRRERSMTILSQRDRALLASSTSLRGRSGTRIPLGRIAA